MLRVRLAAMWPVRKGGRADRREDGCKRDGMPPRNGDARPPKCGEQRLDRLLASRTP
jgi:hypothetical protein